MKTFQMCKYRLIKQSYEQIAQLCELFSQSFNSCNVNMNPARAHLFNCLIIAAYYYWLILVPKCQTQDGFDSELRTELEVINVVMVCASTLKGSGKMKKLYVSLN